MLRLYDTLRDAKAVFVPAVAGNVKMYACGVTVYDDSHVGHARGAVVFDVIRRYLAFKGWRVTYVRNFTDVDDKIIKRAKEEGVSCEAIAMRYIEAYQKDMAALGVAPADLEPKATEHMGEIIALVEQLVASGHAYASGGDVFFRVAAFDGYGKLSKRRPEELLAGARVEVDARKENPLDFVLWKASKEGEPSWESPWGRGRPGWHIECSAMSQTHLGVSFDIHGGGKDLIFPHHENEIAQSEAATGRPFVRYWLHNGFVNIDQEKMSKSLGNFFTIREVLARFHPEAVRLFLLLTHYRSPIDFSDQNLKDAERARRRVYNLLAEVARRVDSGADAAAVPVPDDATGALGRQIDEMMVQFEAAMDDDFNTARALGHIFETVRLLNGVLQDRPDAPTPALLAVLTAFQENVRGAGAVLGLFQEAPEAVLKGSAEAESDEIEAEISRRLAARKRKDWVEADRIRDTLATRGVLLKDRPDGTTDWEWDR